MTIDTNIIIFILSGFIGYYIVWGITPSLHAPLMSVSNAISGIIVIGAISVLNDAVSDISIILSLIAVIIASVNIFGGFAISNRMLQMFKPKTKDRIKNNE